ncbi:uncharacterized protein V1516DRAFT_505507 [Lipomyces oligophaga]|uniref:uncharacterized protein n=1 Tax=Lipomyces oligophaga TaxID=45792 RepID=UPI0034CFCF9E
MAPSRKLSNSWDDPTRTKRKRPNKSSSTFNGTDLVPPSNISLSDERIHAPGAIRRIAMHDFVTYSNAEFRPGPSLNMIIGPNGTGKSTLVCAIALGLGGRPEVLGRAKEIGQFVKLGSSMATVTIELEGQCGASNPIIERTIFKDNKSTWILNGKSVSSMTISTLVKSFNIQIDNLCQFLPQDKVAEFAHMSPQKLLVETERAAGSIDMVERHRRLAVLSQTHTQLVETTTKDSNELERLIELQERSREEADRFRQRDKVMAQMQELERSRPFVEWKQMSAQYSALREQMRTLSAQVKEQEEATSPAGRTADLFQEKVQATSAVYSKAQESFKVIERSLKEKYSQRESFDTEIENWTSEISGIKSSALKAKEKLDHDKRHLKKIDEFLQNESNKPDGNAILKIKREINTLKASEREVKNEMEDLDAEITRISQEASRSQRKEQDLQIQINKLSSEDAKKLEHLRRVDSDTYRAVIWLRENKELFKQEIFEPPLLSMSIKDQMTDFAVEGTTKRTALLTFTCLSRDDYLLFTKKVLDELKCNISAAEYSRSEHSTLSSWKPDCSTEELQKMGFESWVSDLVTGPDPVLNMLCHQTNLNKVAFNRQGLTAQQVRYIDLAKKPSGGPLISRYISGRNSVYVRVSDYGERDSLKSTQQLRDARFLVNSSSSRTEAEDVQDQLQEVRSHLDELEEERRKVFVKRQEVKQKFADLAGQLHSLEKSKNVLDSISRKWNHEQVARVNLMESIKEAENRPDTVAEEIGELKVKIKLVLNKRDKYISKLIEIAQSCVMAKMNVSKAFLNQVKASSDVQQLQKLMVQAESGLRALKEERREVKRKSMALAQEAKEKQEKLSKEFSQNEIHEIYNFLNERPELLAVEDIDRQLETLQSQLGDVEGNINAVEQFDRRARQITTLQKKVDQNSKLVTEGNAEIMKLRSTWEAELDSLINKISDGFAEAFRSIGCEGKINLGKDEDFEKWCIEIKVRFRENEQLQLLTHQRQSGGERSVSTIFYLMALQGVTKSPFRVVDEINQGMDPRNERVVHGRMVDIACSNDQSQYFLITPKLLPDLKYKPRMLMHCIFSSDLMPDPIREKEKATIGCLSTFVKEGYRLGCNNGYRTNLSGI